jgi:hypothetical protein
VVVRWLPLSRCIPDTSQGPSQLGESCGALLGMVLVVGLGPDLGFPPAFDMGALVVAVATSAYTCLWPGPVGNPEGPPKEGVLQLHRPGNTGFLWGPSSCLHQSRSLQRRHPSGPLRVIDTRGPAQLRPPRHRPPFLCRAGGEAGSRLWKTARVVR